MIEFTTQLCINGVVTGMTYALMATGLTLIFGILNIVNFAHGEFYMLGAYATYYVMLWAGIPYLPAVLVSVIFVGFIGAICSKLTINPLRDRHWSSILLATFGLSFIFLEGGNFLFGGQSRSIGTSLTNEIVKFGDLFITKQRLLIIGVSLICIIATKYLIQKTTLGKILRASAQNRIGSALVGINLDSVYTWTFTLGTALAALSGALIGATTYIYPVMGQLGLFYIFLVVIAGGLGSIGGAIITGLLLGIVQSLADGFLTPVVADIAGYCAMVILLLLRPQGLMGLSVGK